MRRGVVTDPMEVSGGSQAGVWEAGAMPAARRERLGLTHADTGAKCAPTTKGTGRLQRNPHKSSLASSGRQKHGGFHIFFLSFFKKIYIFRKGPLQLTPPCWWTQLLQRMGYTRDPPWLGAESSLFRFVFYFAKPHGASPATEVPDAPGEAAAKTQVFLFLSFLSCLDVHFSALCGWPR